MAQSQKIKWWSAERMDLPDVLNDQLFVEQDFQLQNMHLLGGGLTSWVIKGFITTSSGGNVVSIAPANSALFQLTSATDLRGVLFVGDAGLAAISVTLSNGTTNYIHVKLDRATSSAALRTFWDKSRNTGLGGEVQYIVDTAEIKQVTIVVTTGAASADPEHVLIAKAVVDGAGTLTSLIDERNLYFRLGKNDEYVGIGVIGDVTYVPIGAPGLDDLSTAGAFTGSADLTYTITIDATGPDTFTWTDGTTTVTGVAITTLNQSLNNGVAVIFAAAAGHTLGDSWTFVAVANTGADYVFNLGIPAEQSPDAILNPNAFAYGDKEVDNLKEWMDLIMTQIKEIKFGSTTANYWFEETPSNLSEFGVHLNGGGILTWTCPVPAALGTLNWDSDLIILLPGTAFSNTLTAVPAPGPGLDFLTNNMVAYVDLDKTGSVALTPHVIASASYTPAKDRVIFARRIDDAIYVGI